eukprot:252436-Amphidinium_carterae.1
MSPKRVKESEQCQNVLLTPFLPRRKSLSLAPFGSAEKEGKGCEQPVLLAAHPRDAGTTYAAQPREP